MTVSIGDFHIIGNLFLSAVVTVLLHLVDRYKLIVISILTNPPGLFASVGHSFFREEDQ